MKRITFFVIVASWLAGQSAFAFERLFETRIDYQTGYSTSHVTVSDFDMDGLPDLVVTEHSSDYITVLLNDTDCEFRRRTNYTLSDGPVSTRAADLDNDGDSDIATICYLQDVFILINDGFGNFDSSYTYNRSGRHNFIRVGDMDSDSDIDLVVGSNYGMVDIYFNDGVGHFPQSTDFDTFGTIVSGNLSDFDGDDDLDIAVVNTSGDDFKIYLNSGTGDFDLGYNRTLSNFNPRFIASADFDQDGDIDLVIADDYDGQIHFRFNAGDATFDSNSVNDSDAGCRALVIDDFDNDSDVDVFAVNYYAENIGLYRNSVNGVFEQAIYFSAGDGPQSIAASDFNGDGNSDIVTANRLSGDISIFQNDGNGGLISPFELSVSDTVMAMIIAADFDLDNNMDIAAFDLSRNVFIFRNFGNSQFSLSNTYAQVAQVTDLEAADFNNDGSFDLAIPLTGQAGVSIYLNDGHGNHSSSGRYNAATTNVALTSGDFDNDYDIDLASIRTTQYITIIRNVGTGYFAVDSLFPIVGFPLDICSVDIDTDTDIDFVVAQDEIRIVYNNGTGGFYSFQDLCGNCGCSAIKIADLDGDGLKDIIGFNEDYTRYFIFKNLGNGDFADSLIYDSTDDDIDFVAADVDESSGDEIVTVAQARNFVNLLYYAPDQISEDSIKYGTRRKTYAITAADFDNNSELDLAIGHEDGHLSVVYHTSDVDEVIDEEIAPPRIFGLLKIFPNPFNSSVTISYSLDEKQEVIISIYNVLGQKMAEIDDGIKDAGKNSLIWNAEDMPSGVYFARLDSDRDIKIGKMVLLK